MKSKTNTVPIRFATSFLGRQENRKGSVKSRCMPNDQGESRGLVGVPPACINRAIVEANTPKKLKCPKCKESMEWNKAHKCEEKLFTRKDLQAFGDFVRDCSKKEITKLKRDLEMAIGEVARLRKKLGYDK
jgi:hypothetical protein